MRSQRANCVGVGAGLPKGQRPGGPAVPLRDGARR
jgi:hypothetical protein